MKEIQNRETDEALLIINGDSMSGNEFVKHMKLPYLYSEYSMEFKTNEIQKQQIIIYSLLLQLQNHFDLIEISSKAFGDSVENTATWLK